MKLLFLADKVWWTWQHRFLLLHIRTIDIDTRSRVLRDSEYPTILVGRLVPIHISFITAVVLVSEAHIVLVERNHFGLANVTALDLNIVGILILTSGWHDAVLLHRCFVIKLLLLRDLSCLFAMHEWAHLIDVRNLNSLRSDRVMLHCIQIRGMWVQLIHHFLQCVLVERFDFRLPVAASRVVVLLETDLALSLRTSTVRLLPWSSFHSVCTCYQINNKVIYL